MNKLTFKIASFFVILLTLCNCAKDEEVMTGIIIGKVTDTNGELLSSVTVTLSPSGLSRTTGNDGVFEMVDLEPMQYTLQATKAGYKTNTKTVSVVAGKTISGDMVLAPESKKAEISLEPSTLNFGTTLNQMSITVSNKGNVSTTWSLDLGDNHWLSATPMEGNIGAGKTQNIVFSLDRNKFTEAKNAVITLAADGNSFPITVSCSPDNSKKAEMKIEPTTLEFGDNLNNKDLTIQNVGEGELNWQIKDINENLITISEMSGTVAAGGSKIVKVNLDREKMTADINTSFIISDGEKEQAITVTASKKVLKADMKIEPTTLDFGNDLNTKEFTIKNAGDGELNWEIKGISENTITVSETSGTIVAGGSKIVKVNLDREKMTADISTSFIISDGEKEQAITITATKNNPSEDNNQGETEKTFSGTVTSCRDQLAVELTGVSKSNGVLTVDFTIQNNEDFDIYQFSFSKSWGEFMAYDNLGNSYDKYKIQEIKLGSEVDAGWLFDVRMGIPQGVKLSCRLKIKDVADEATEFTNISLPCLYYNQAETVTYNQKKLVFKNLKWQ